jgi:transposase
LIGIEAGMATHYVARELIALGHDVRQVPPAYARPFRQAHKNDFRDAYAIAEAVQRPSTCFVPVKGRSFKWLPRKSDSRSMRATRCCAASRPSCGISVAGRLRQVAINCERCNEVVINIG